MFKLVQTVLLKPQAATHVVHALNILKKIDNLDTTLIMYPGLCMLTCCWHSSLFLNSAKIGVCWGYITVSEIARYWVGHCINGLLEEEKRDMLNKCVSSGIRLKHLMCTYVYTAAILVYWDAIRGGFSQSPTKRYLTMKFFLNKSEVPKHNIQRMDYTAVGIIDLYRKFNLSEFKFG